jgi:hypothetical protein
MAFEGYVDCLNSKLVAVSVEALKELLVIGPYASAVSVVGVGVVDDGFDNSLLMALTTLSTGI